MAGLLDFLFQGQGGGLLGGQPMNIAPPQAQFGQQQGGGLLGRLSGALGQIADPEGQRQQQAMRNYILMQQLGLQQKEFGLKETALKEKPQVVWQEDETGRKVPYQVNPMGGGITRMQIQGQPMQAQTDLPPGISPKIVQEKRSAAYVANEEAAVKDAKAAADLKPIIDEAAAAYEEAQNLGAIGPVVGSTPGRWAATGMASLGDATGLGSTSRAAESARQRYDRAKAALQARATQVQNAGQGAVSNYERELFSKPIPDLTTLDPGEAMNVFKQMKAQTEQTVGAGRMSKLGQAPAVSAVLDRPSIPGGLTVPGAPPMPGAPAGPQGGSPLDDARRAISMGAPRDAVINRLIKNGINPAGL